ncbi:hypothetical protein HJ030_24675 [Vibrio parahaemolyticus]|nr:hypothetical protein [Vibrio parahaemolyticus]
MKLDANIKLMKNKQFDRGTLVPFYVYPTSAAIMTNDKKKDNYGGCGVFIAFLCGGNERNSTVRGRTF